MKIVMKTCLVALAAVPASFCQDIDEDINEDIDEVDLLAQTIQDAALKFRVDLAARRALLGQAFSTTWKIPSPSPSFRRGTGRGAGDASASESGGTSDTGGSSSNSGTSGTGNSSTSSGAASGFSSGNSRVGGKLDGTPGYGDAHYGHGYGQGMHGSDMYGRDLSSGYGQDMSLGKATMYQQQGGTGFN